MKRKLLVGFLVLIAALAIVSAASAQNQKPPVPTPSANDVNAIAKKLYCPVCPNTPLDVCATQACIDWRSQIRDQLSAGWSEKQIVDYFVTQYGERVLAEPERGGFNSLIWMLPVIGAIAGLAVAWLVIRSWKKSRVAALPVQQPSPDIPQDVLSRIEKELRELDL